jgi:hypothetical protein
MLQMLDGFVVRYTDNDSPATARINALAEPRQPVVRQLDSRGLSLCDSSARSAGGARTTTDPHRRPQAIARCDTVPAVNRRDHMADRQLVHSCAASDPTAAIVARAAPSSAS